jgi:hypothetical protein
MPLTHAVMKALSVAVCPHCGADAEACPGFVQRSTAVPGHYLQCRFQVNIPEALLCREHHAHIDAEARHD